VGIEKGRLKLSGLVIPKLKNETDEVKKFEHRNLLEEERQELPWKAAEALQMNDIVTVMLTPLSSGVPLKRRRR
jgi:hypothetical protein